MYIVTNSFMYILFTALKLVIEHVQLHVNAVIQDMCIFKIKINPMQDLLPINSITISFKTASVPSSSFPSIIEYLLIKVVPNPSQCGVFTSGHSTPGVELVQV